MENGMTALALPDEQTFRRDIQAINRFQQVVHSTMVRDLDYGIIPGTQKPTLLKPGAEKIAKLLGLSDQYEIMDKTEEWQSPFFRYLIKCTLIHIASGSIISEGLGECNSMESKYRWRWLGERDLPSSIDKTKLVSQERRSKTGGHWTVYRLDNEDIYSQVNTILKMAKKRALVDAALSAGRLSDVFTQDLEDGGIIDTPPEPKSESKTQKEAEGESKKMLKADKDGTLAQEVSEGNQKIQPEPEHPIPGTSGEGDAENTGQSVSSTIESQRDELYQIIADNMKWKNTKASRTWLVNVLKVEEKLIDSDPQAVMKELKTHKREWF